MNTRDIIIKYLTEIGANGLAGDGCGCGIDDLAPCQGDCSECVPAKRVVAIEPGENHDIGDQIWTSDHTFDIPRDYKTECDVMENALNSIWQIMYPGRDDWKYPGQVSAHIRAYVSEIRDKP